MSLIIINTDILDQQIAESQVFLRHLESNNCRLTTFCEGFFNQGASRSSTYNAPVYAAPQGRAHSGFVDTPAVERAVDEDAEDKKLQKELYALLDLIRTPSNHAQIRAINAIESLATKGRFFYRICLI